YKWKADGSELLAKIKRASPRPRQSRGDMSYIAAIECQYGGDAHGAERSTKADRNGPARKTSGTGKQHSAQSVLPVPSKRFGVFPTAADEKVSSSPQSQATGTSARSWWRAGDLGACFGTP